MRAREYKLVVTALFAFQPSLVLAQAFTSPDRLTKEMAGARLSPDIIAAMGIDPLVGASDPQVTQLMFSPSQGGEARRATVEVSFHNRREPVELRFELIEEERYGWQIDHFQGRSGAVEWCSRSMVEAMKRAAD